MWRRPVADGRRRVMVVQSGEYERLKRRDRQALAVEELSAAEIEAISRSEPPAEAARYDHEVTVGQGGSDFSETGINVIDRWESARAPRPNAWPPQGHPYAGALRWARTAMTPSSFIAKWRASEFKGRSATQSHFNDLRQLLRELTPTDADTVGDWYCFERVARRDAGGNGWDVWPRTSARNSAHTTPTST